MPSERITLIMTLTINDGAVDAVTDILQQSRDMVVANEPGTLTYDCYLHGNVCRYVEVYESSAALMDHVTGKVGTELAPRLFEHASLDSVLSFGEPTPEARSVLEQFGATINGSPVYSRELSPVGHTIT